METLKRYLIFLVGLFVNSLGVSLITKVNLGTSPISSIPYVLSLNFPFTLGNFTIFFSIFLIVLQLIILRKNFKLEHILQIPVSIIFGYFIDFTMILLSRVNPEEYIMKIVYLLIGCLIFIALGISMLFYSFMSVTKMILFSGIILTADGAVDIVFLVMLRLGMRKTEKLRNEKPKEDKKQEKPEPVETGSEESNTESYPEYTGNSENSSESDINTVYQTEDSTENSIEDSYQAEDSAQTEGSDQTENNAKCQEPETNLELETEETADEADAKVILDKKVYSADADVESPNREIREMLKNHDEPLEEWKD